MLLLVSYLDLIYLRHCLSKNYKCGIDLFFIDRLYFIFRKIIFYYKHNASSSKKFESKNLEL